MACRRSLVAEAEAVHGALPWPLAPYTWGTPLDPHRFYLKPSKKHQFKTMVPVEPISLSVGVATLFSTCVECFKYFKAGQAQHADYELLELEFDLIKSRMLIWGNAIGIGNVTEGAATTEDDTSEPMSLLARSLNAVKSLLEDYKTLQNKYGLKEVTETTRSTASVRDLPSFQPLNLFRTSRLYIRLRGRRPNATSTNLASRTFWAIIDKEKFEDLVAHLKKLVDGLESVYPIPVAARDQTFQSSVATIEFSKLRIVDAACEVVYPELEWASIARTVKDASDLGTLDLRNVAEWRTDTRPIATTSSPSLEFIGTVVNTRKRFLFFMLKYLRSIRVSSYSRVPSLDGAV